jgi:hypothetical protein
MMLKINWLGNNIQRHVEAGLSSGLAEFGLRCEAAAKTRLQPHHGVKTGTLRRSLHTATPGYNWAGDNAMPSAASPELGGETAEPSNKSGKLTLEIGSGMEYSLAVHQGHGSFTGYHFLTEAIAEQSPKLGGILKRHVSEKGG